jgi:hypothetical protein
VYAVGHPVLPPEGELTAALLFVGPGAALSHATAAWWWGMTDQEPDVIEISTTRQRVSAHGITIHHPRRLQRVWHRRLPVTPVAQTLLDFAASAPLDRVRRALADAEYQGLIDLDRLPEAFGRGRPGSARLRAALRIHQPELARTRSRLERAFLALCEAFGLPIPEINTYVCGYLVDATWREQPSSSSSTVGGLTAPAHSSSATTDETSSSARMTSRLAATRSVSCATSAPRSSRTCRRACASWRASSSGRRQARPRSGSHTSQWSFGVRFSLTATAAALAPRWLMGASSAGRAAWGTTVTAWVEANADWRYAETPGTLSS